MTFKIRKIERTDTVYDITVDIDHSFTVGNNKMVVHNCSGGSIDDSVYGFYEAQLEAAVLSKNGFGTSGYMGDIRPRGSSINGVKGGASGVLPVFKDFVQLSRDISQGSSRRGAWAGYIEIDHPDFFELVNYILKNPDDANIGWNVSDAFIERLDNGDSDAIERYQKALKLKMITGKGYFHFVDKVNRQNPQMYKDKGIKVKASNLCVSGDTILTVKYNNDSDEINLPIKDVRLPSNDSTLLVKSLNIDTNEIEWKPITNHALTKKSQKVLKITDSNTGKSLLCTPCHLIYTTNRGYVRADELTSNDILTLG